MIILETEAANYECPEKSTKTIVRNCSGKKCMWWRWFDFRDHRGANSYGFCGRGGRPCVLEVEKTGK